MNRVLPLSLPFTPDLMTGETGQASSSRASMGPGHAHAHKVWDLGLWLFPLLPEYNAQKPKSIKRP